MLYSQNIDLNLVLLFFNIVIINSQYIISNTFGIKFRHLIVILFVLLISVNKSLGQSVLEKYKLSHVIEKHDKQFEHFTTADGILSSKINCLFQDKFGFIWLGTDNGLNRFDGYEFVAFQHDNGDSASISDNFISCITEDSNGDFWVGTKIGLNKFNRKNNSFERFYQEDYNDNSLYDNHIRAIYADSNAVLWIESMNCVLSKFEISKNNFTHFKHKPYHTIIPKHYLRHFIVEDNNNNLWIGSRAIGVYVFNKEKEVFTRHLRNKITSEGYKGLDNLGSHNLSCLYIDKDENFLFGSSSNELNIMDHENGLFYKYEKLDGVTDIAEDNLGFLWISTSADGIYCYNKNNKQLQHYTNNPDDPNSILNNSVEDIIIDKSGIIWLATKSGLSKFSYIKNQFSHFHHIVGNSNSISANYITALHEDETGKIWIGTIRNGVDIYSRELNTFQHISENTGKLSLLSNRVSVLHEDKNSIYIGLMAGKGFHIYDKTTQTISSHTYMPNSSRKDWYKGFINGIDGNLIIGTWGGYGLLYFDLKQKIFLQKHHFKAYNAFMNKAISEISLGPENNIWIQGTNFYIMKVNPETKSHQIYFDQDYIKVRYNNANGLGLHHLGSGSGKYYNTKFIELTGYNSRTKTLFTDINKNLWLITSNGLRKYIPENECFKHYKYFNIIKLGNSYSGTHIWGFSEKGFFIFHPEKGVYKNFDLLKNIDSGVLNALLEDHKKNLWLATDDGLIRYNLNSNEIYKFKNELNSLNSIDNNNIKILYYTKEALWVGTDEGLNKYDFETNNFVAKDRISIKNINKVELIDNIFWIATDNGFWKYDLITKEKTVYKHNALNQYSLLSNQVFNIVKDTMNNLWFGTDNGFGYFDTKTNQFYDFNEPKDNTILSFLTNFMMVDSKENIWVGTADKGVYCLNQKTGNFKYFTNKPYDSTSLSAGSVSVIFEDSKHNIWVGNDNLNLLQKKNESFKIILSEKNGLPGKIKGILEDNHNNLWISTTNGLVKFNLQTYKIQTFVNEDGIQSNEFTKAHAKLKTGEMMFGGVNGFNLFHPDSIKTNAYIPPIVLTSFYIFEEKKNIDLTGSETVKLNYNENFFSIEFASLDFTSPESNQYEYILEGFDKTWHKVKNERIANYTKVSPGKYKFKVKGSNSDGIWNKTGASIGIEIKPPFWKTWWFIGLVIVIIFYSIYRLINYRFIRIQSQNQAIVLEQKLLRSQMHPHFIFNSLTAIQSFIYKKDPAQAGRYLSKFAKLMRLILENSRTEYINIETELNTLEHYLELQNLRFPNLFNYTIEIDERLDKEITLIPPMLAQPFLENAIEHGMINKTSEGHILISFKLKNNYLEYCIEDDGIGIKKSKEQSKGKEKEHRSLATKITSERISSFNKINTSSIFMTITDLNDVDPGKTGTLVCFKIPLHYQ